MEPNIPRPSYDEELNKTLASLAFPAVITPDLIPIVREKAELTPSPDQILANQPVRHDERTITGPSGNITLSIFRSESSTSPLRPAILYFNGGGFVTGNRFWGGYLVFSSTSRNSTQ
jgi:acetyl esterase/lipase